MPLKESTSTLLPPHSTPNLHPKLSLLTSLSSTVCGPKSGTSGTYGAALSDLSPLWTGGKCDGYVDTSKCNGQNPISGYSGPACPKDTCGKCYKVCNQGGY